VSAPHPARRPRARADHTGRTPAADAESPVPAVYDRDADGKRPTRSSPNGAARRQRRKPRRAAEEGRRVPGPLDAAGFGDETEEQSKTAKNAPAASTGYQRESVLEAAIKARRARSRPPSAGAGARLLGILETVRYFLFPASVEDCRRPPLAADMWLPRLP